MKKTHFGMSDGGWDAFKKRMEENTQQAIQNGEYGHAAKAKKPTFVVAPPNDPNSCPSYCPECQGMNYAIDPETGEVNECKRYRARLEKLGISDPSRNPAEGTRIDAQRRWPPDT